MRLYHHSLSAAWGITLLATVIALLPATQPAKGADVARALATSRPAPTSKRALPATQATYYVIPVKGEVHVGMAEVVGKALAAARGLKATHIVIVLATPGGDLFEMWKVLDLIAASPEFHFVALVDNAGSAGAIIALACPDIVITPGGAMGAAAVIGGPDDRILRMKVESYNLAKIRAAVEAAGHEVLLARGMIEPELELALVTNQDGTSRIVEGDEAAKLQAARVKPPGVVNVVTLKSRNKLISLAPEEAINLHVARGILPTSKQPRASDVSYPMNDIAPMIGLEKWKQVGSAAQMMRKFQANVERENYFAEHKQELQTLDSKLRGLQYEVNSRQGQINTFKTALEDPQRSASSRALLQSDIAAIQGEIRPILGEIAALQRRGKEILDAAPKKP